MRKRRQHELSRGASSRRGFNFLPGLLALISFSFAFADPAAAESRVSVVRMHPGDEARLAPNEAFYILIAYESDEPISIWARPSRDGVEVREARTNASSPHVGSGEALGWFELMQPGYVDEVIIRAGGGKPYREWELARVPVDLEWKASGKARPRPKWLEQAIATERARMDERIQQMASEPVSGGEMALATGFVFFMFAVGVAGLILPIRAVKRWQGGWRIAAMVPVAIVGLAVLNIIIGGLIDPTSHNLWPFELLMYGGGALAVIFVLWLLRKITGADR